MSRDRTMAGTNLVLLPCPICSRFPTIRQSQRAPFEEAWKAVCKGTADHRHTVEVERTGAQAEVVKAWNVRGQS